VKRLAHQHGFSSVTSLIRHLMAEPFLASLSKVGLPASEDDQYTQLCQITLVEYMKTYQHFPLMHPHAVKELYTSALDKDNPECNYLFGMIDALCSLISLVTGDSPKALYFYNLGKNRLKTLVDDCVERIIINTIFVSTHPSSG